MKRYLVLLVLLGITTVTFAQNNPRPSKSRFWLNKHSTFQIKPGDILVYDVNNNGEKHQLLITITSYSDANGISFDYNVPKKNKKGSINIPSAKVKSAVTYENMFVSSADDSNKSKGTIWLSKDNFRELGAGNSKQTRMDMGSGTETFVRHTGSVQKIKYKGKEKIISVFKIANEGGTDKKEFTVLTDMNNPLIVNWNNGAITLKEVR